MMKKALMVVAIAALSMVGSAVAETVEINMTGASAQFKFWDAASVDFLNSLGCSNVQNASANKQGVTEGTACTSFNGDDVVFRYTSKASFDGIVSLLGDTPPGTTNCEPNNLQRQFRTSVADATLVCKDVSIGASDVAGEAFVQTSFGELNGPAGGGFEVRTFSGLDSSTLNNRQPLVVPFAFFVNKDVTIKTCESGDQVGEQCRDNADCPNGTCSAPATIENLTREQVVALFSGQVANWQDFGAGYANLDVTACLRHAGSGTHASLDLAVMNSAWGGNMVSFENAFSAPFIYFNDSSSNLINCVDTQAGGVGYADADKNDGATNNVRRVKYQGEEPTRINIRNGIYEFWAAQWMFADPNEPVQGAKKLQFFNLLADFAADPANIIGSKAKYWAAQDEMKFFKSTDFSYPQNVGASIPQLP